MNLGLSEKPDAKTCVTKTHHNGRFMVYGV